MSYRVRGNLLPGGIGDKKKREDFSKDILDEGISVEKEHSSDPEIAEEIAIDHLTEDKDYYKKLRKYVETSVRASVSRRIGSTLSEKGLRDLKNKRKQERKDKLDEQWRRRVEKYGLPSTPYPTKDSDLPAPRPIRPGESVSKWYLDNEREALERDLNNQLYGYYSALRRKYNNAIPPEVWERTVWDWKRRSKQRIRNFETRVLTKGDPFLQEQQEEARRQQYQKHLQRMEEDPSYREEQQVSQRVRDKRYYEKNKDKVNKKKRDYNRDYARQQYSQMSEEDKRLVYEKNRQRDLERMQKDPEFAERVKKQKQEADRKRKEKHRERMKSDPEYAEAYRAKQRVWRDRNREKSKV